jgi:hypothetical protein
MQNKWFITGIKQKKDATGSDFYIDLLSFFSSFGFKVVNTLKYGHILLIVRELCLLLTIPRHSIVITTWPGYPRQLLVFNGLTNRMRYTIFILFKKVKNWKLVLLPIDLPLEQFRNRLSKNFIKRQEILENELFKNVDFFLCCGKQMTHHFKNKYPSKKIIQFDMYDQLLPDYTPIKLERSHKIKIAVSGNMERMSGALNVLPKSKNIEYYFTGPHCNSQNYERDDFYYLGVIEDDEYLLTLGKYDYGLIFYDNSVSEYFSLNIAGKITSYLLAGLPVICPVKYASMAELIERKKIGIVIETFNDILCCPLSLSEEYNNMRENCLKHIPLIRQGKHYYEALKKIDAGPLV